MLGVKAPFSISEFKIITILMCFKRNICYELEHR